MLESFVIKCVFNPMKKDNEIIMRAFRRKRKRGSDTYAFSWQMLFDEWEYQKTKQSKDESEGKESESEESETNPISQLIDATKDEMCKNGHCNWDNTVREVYQR